MKKIILSVCFLVIVCFARFAWAVDTNIFGVHVSGKGRLPGLMETLQDLNVKWIRVNCPLGDDDCPAEKYLQKGINVVITVINNDPTNMDTSFGGAENAGYPYRSRENYQNKVREIIRSLKPYLSHDRTILMQCENEIGDASMNPKSRYWRGTLDQYIQQMDAFYEAVKSVDPAIIVSLTSFPSESLDAVIDPGNQRHSYAVKKVTKLLSEGKYDAVDLHFYGCVEDISSKVHWVKAHMPVGKQWISTENGGPDFRCASTPLHYDDDPSQYEKIQAVQVVQRLSACRDNGGSVCLWFSLADLRKEVEAFRHMGLLDQSGLGSQKELIQEFKRKKRSSGKDFSVSEEQSDKMASLLRKRPAYFAFKEFISDK